MSRAEQAPFGISEVLFNTNLIAHVKITSHTQDNFTVKVIDVLHHYRSSIQPGHYIRIKNDFSIVCPAAFPIEYAVQKREALAFLSYHKGSWYITHNEIGFLNENKARIAFPKQGHYYNGTIEEWKKDLDTYFAHFSVGKDKKIIPKYTQDQLKGKVLNDLIWLQYRAIYLFNESQQLPDTRLESSIVHIEQVEDINPNNETIQQAIKRHPIHQDSIPSIMQKITDYIYRNYPTIKASEIKGITLYSLLFEKDGTISKVKIIRSVHPEIDAGIKAYFKENNQWLPPHDENNQPMRYWQNLPLIIR